MKNLAQKGSVFGVFAMALSAAVMIWLFCRFPVATAVTTLAVLIAFELSARVSDLIEAEGKSGFDH